MQENMALGQKIRARREELELTREQLIAKVEGLSLSTLIRIELRGGVPRVHTLVNLAGSLGMSVDQLLADAEQVSA